MYRKTNQSVCLEHDFASSKNHSHIVKLSHQQRKSKSPFFKGCAVLLCMDAVYYELPCLENFAKEFIVTSFLEHRFFFFLLLFDGWNGFIM